MTRFDGIICALLLALALLVGWPTPIGAAATLRVAMAVDAGTLDPHALNAGSTAMMTRQVYEPLVGRGRAMEKVPGLALAWTLEEPTRWRFRLRPGVRFHDGAAFDADDVVFSIGRVRAPTSDLKIFVSGIREARRVDDLTVDILTDGPDPVLPDKLTRVFIMDAAWSRSHAVEQPQNYRNREETYAVRHANGTGPYRLVRREPDSRTELQRFDGWWGRSEDQVGNVSDVVYLPIANDATRISALLAGDIDFILDVPPQAQATLQRDVRVKLVEGPENRTIFLGMNQQLAELADSDVKGRNPFKDLRVRQAIYHAIDIDAIHLRTMRGHSVITGAMWAPSVFGYARDEDVRLPFDRERARRLLADAGFPSGFSVGMDCSNNRYVSDEQICVAIVAMLAQVGIRVNLNAQPFARFVPRLQRRESSFFLLGWAAATFDALITLEAIIQTPGTGAAGSANFSGYSNAAIDALIATTRTEADPGRRLDLLRRAHRLHNQDVGHIPLHHQTIAWAMRSGIDAVIQPENQLDVKWVRVAPGGR